MTETVTPTVSMLWEPNDPARALKRRFGFATADAAVSWLGDALFNHWGITIDHCERLVLSASNALAWVGAGDRQLIAKWSGVPTLYTRLEKTAQLTAWLARRGIPVAAPIPATDGRLQLEVGRFSLGLQPKVGGELLDVDDAAQVKEAGRMLSRVHEALGAYPHPIDDRTSAAIEQLIHNDYRSANILYHGESITALLDLEDVSYGTRVADLAKSAVLLGTRYHNWRPTTEAVRQVFIAAYQDQTPLTSAERREVSHLVGKWLQEMGSAD
jgi:homoserine kinase type II